MIAGFSNVYSILFYCQFQCKDRLDFIFFFNNVVADTFSFLIYHQRNAKVHNTILSARLPADAN